jgi:hypothetical protein
MATLTLGALTTSARANPVLTNTLNGLGRVGSPTNPSLGTPFGLSSDFKYTFLGWSTTTDSLAVGTTGTLSNDIRNTAVPEPGSFFLLGSGLLCAAGSVRRRLNLKASF